MTRHRRIAFVVRRGRGMGCGQESEDSMQYAITEPGAGHISSDDTTFCETVEEAIEDAVSSGANSIDEIRFVKAKRTRIVPPRVSDDVESALDGFDADTLHEIVTQMDDAIKAAQSLLDEAFAKANERGFWVETDDEIDREPYRDAFTEALNKANAHAEGEAAYHSHTAPF